MPTPPTAEQSHSTNSPITELTAATETETATETAATSTSTTETQPKLKRALPYLGVLVFGTVVLLVLIGSAFILNTRQTTHDALTSTETAKSNPTPVISLSPTNTLSQTPLFTGKLERLEQDLQLFTLTEDEKVNSRTDHSVYYSAGVFSQGELEGYTRIIAIHQPDGPMSPLTFTLATKDFQKYILDDPENKTVAFPLDDWRNPYTEIDKTKISNVATFETEQPSSISLDQQFALFYEELPVASVETSKLDAYGNPFYDILLTTDYATFQLLASPVPHLSVYFQPYVQNDTYFESLSPMAKEQFLLRKKYFLGLSQVIVVDSVGLPAVYAMTTPENITEYTRKKADFDIAWKQYEDQVALQAKSPETEMAIAPAPEPVFLPTLGFKGTDVVAPNTFTFFKQYQAAFPSSCSTSLNSRVLAVSDRELEQVGTIRELPVFRLVDQNHPLYELAYQNKLAYYEQDATAWDQINMGMPKPTLEEYVNKNPLLFVKNYWQQWVALGEYDINLPGGCGKPVVYLYPTEPTDVSVKLDVLVQFTTDIPKYADSWRVRAYPDGSLTNLKPEFTNCAELDTQHLGTEYALEACQTNKYPYLFWAGNVASKNYPTLENGWIVEQNRLADFFNEKLLQMGLSDSERNDFTSYWVAALSEQNAPYHRISFLQTPEVNQLFPMTVSPQPDTVFRIFLDHTPLYKKPKQLPQPQRLNKLTRKGFTLVEWGGLKETN